VQGHGVPRPTANGEIWVFNRNYTQYIPLSIYELQTWTGVPAIYVFDCSNAGLIVQWFMEFAEQVRVMVLQHIKKTFARVCSEIASIATAKLTSRLLRSRRRQLQHRWRVRTRWRTPCRLWRSAIRWLPVALWAHW
jgi:hypothetical protein